MPGPPIHLYNYAGSTVHVHDYYYTCSLHVLYMYSSWLVVHSLFVTGQSAILVMDSEGYVSLYSLPDLKLIYKENCVDAADAVWVCVQSIIEQ